MSERMFNQWVAVLCTVGLLVSFFLVFSSPSPHRKTIQQRTPAPETLRVAVPEKEEQIESSAF